MRVREFISQEQGRAVTIYGDRIMQRGYQYKIYDTVKKEWFSDLYQSAEVRKLLGIKGSIADRVKAAALVKGRFRIEIVGEWPEPGKTFKEEWDEARFRLLRAGGEQAAESE